MAILEVRDVHKSFQIPRVRRNTVREKVFGLLRPDSLEELRVLNGVSFSVARGEAVGIMGRNGSGKSTLLKIICGIYRPDAGTVAIKAPFTPILELGIGWNHELDALDNVLLLATVLGMSLRAAKASLDEILSFAGLERFARLELKHYSTGMASRLAYAVAFHAAQDVLVLDEILAVGDAGFRARCEERYRQLRAAGRTILLVTHDPQTISAFCDRALLLEGGRVLMNGEPQAIAEAYVGVAATPPKGPSPSP